MKFLIKTFLIIYLNLYWQNCNQFSVNKKIQSYEQQCNNHGYLFNEKCYCYSQYQGDKCQERNSHGWFQSNDKCEDFIIRLDHLLNINPEFYGGEDDEFPTLSGNSLGDFSEEYKEQNENWTQMHQLIHQKDFTIFGDNLSARQFQQGGLGNCYLFAALASLVNIRNGEIIRDVFQTKADNEKHVYVTRWFIGGKPRFVAVDEWIPGTKRKLLFGNYFKGKSFWAIILEKAWAKIHKDYQITSYGYFAEIVKALTQARQDNLKINKKKKNIYNIVKNLLQKQYAVGSYTFNQNQLKNKQINNKFKLEISHIYSILKAYEIENDQGIKTKLIKVFNPWNKEQWIDNPWGNSSPNWSDMMKKKYDIDENEGIFHLTPEDFNQQFANIQWVEIKQNYHQYWIDVPLSYQKLDYEQEFILKNAKLQDIYVFSDEFSDRFLNRYQCNNPFFLIPQSFRIIDPQQQLLLPQNIESAEIKINNAKDGRYSLEILVKKQFRYMQYFTFSVYAPKGTVSFVDRKDQIIENQQKQCKNRCNDQGRCNTFTGQCICYFGYSGEDCSLVQQIPCPNNCNNKGKCDNKFGVCQCDQGYMGRDCQICRDTLDCKDFTQQGFCEEENIYFEFMRDNCQKSCGESGNKAFTQCNIYLNKQVNKCFDVYCGDHGVCKDGKCICQEGFTGLNCQDLDIKECKDLFKGNKCYNLKKKGDCQNKNQQLMVQNCPKTCRFC